MPLTHPSIDDHCAAALLLHCARTVVLTVPPPITRTNTRKRKTSPVTQQSSQRKPKITVRRYKAKPLLPTNPTPCAMCKGSACFFSKVGAGLYRRNGSKVPGGTFRLNLYGNLLSQCRGKLKARELNLHFANNRSVRDVLAEYIGNAPDSDRFTLLHEIVHQLAHLTALELDDIMANKKFLERSEGSYRRYQLGRWVGCEMDE